MGSLTTRELRIARNEALFRDVNERVRHVHVDWQAQAGPAPLRIVCECSRSACAATFEVTYEDYERVRAAATRFFVLHDHEEPDVERVVEHAPGYDVVEKTGASREVAIELNPRR
jgi:hypothetical protein